jgi:transglutaminase-like putative cysteine protease
VTIGGRPRAQAGELSIASEVALGALTVAGVISFGRLFENGRFFGPALVAAVASHVMARAWRRLGLSLPAAAVLSAVAGTIAVVWLIEPATTSYGIPRGATWHALAHDLRQAWRQFGDVVAPTPSTEGFIAGVVMATWVAAFLADAAAFRFATTFEAVIPSFTLFVFTSALGPEQGRVRYTIVYLAGVLAFVLVATASRRAETTSWFAGRRGGGALTIAQGGVGMAAASVVLAAVVGPFLPGADGPPLLAWRNRDRSGPHNRVTVSPLVDIRARLIEQNDDELFTVETSFRRARYWRLTALDAFDGKIWKSSNRYRQVSGSLTEGEPNRAREETLRQEYAIANLSSIWMPAAARPERIDVASGARWDEESGSLIASTDTANGLRYTVTSKIPLYTESALERATAFVPDHIRSRYVPLPDDFPADVVSEARRVTAGTTSPYRKALALQQYFRGPTFTYDLNVPLGHDQDAIQTFLFDTRRGYCQQFAGTYAAMARAIGLPARVAVGFVPGALRGNLFHVRGKDAHAWPEVYFAGYGWVPFEPTPTRAAPGTESYTHTESYRVDTGDEPATATSAPPTTVAPGEPGASNRNLRNLEAEGTGSAAGPTPTPWWRHPLLILAVLGGAGVAGVVIPPVVRGVRRRRRRAAADSPSARVLVAWEEAEEILAVAAGLPRRPAETPLEYAARVTAAAPVDVGSMVELARSTLAAGFSVSGVDGATAARAVEVGDDVRRVLLGRATTAQRVRWTLDPRRRRATPRA